MTNEELYFENESRKHQIEVARCLSIIVQKILDRAMTHDNTKFEEPERAVFAKNTKELTNLTYGSSEYKLCLRKMKPALDHHYFVNRHHPEHHTEVDPIQGMNIVDIVEMICDWNAASQRHTNGDIYKSIDINEKRFGVNPQLAQILRNTVELLRK